MRCNYNVLIHAIGTCFWHQNPHITCHFYWHYRDYFVYASRQWETTLHGNVVSRRRYIVTSSLIGRAHTQNDPCIILYFQHEQHSNLSEQAPTPTHTYRNQTVKHMATPVHRHPAPPRPLPVHRQLAAATGSSSAPSAVRHEGHVAATGQVTAREQGGKMNDPKTQSCTKPASANITQVKNTSTSLELQTNSSSSSTSEAPKKYIPIFKSQIRKPAFKPATMTASKPKVVPKFAAAATKTKTPAKSMSEFDRIFKNNRDFLEDIKSSKKPTVVNVSRAVPILSRKLTLPSSTRPVAFSSSKTGPVAFSPSTARSTTFSTSTTGPATFSTSTTGPATFSTSTTGSATFSTSKTGPAMMPQRPGPSMMGHPAPHRAVAAMAAPTTPRRAGSMGAPATPMTPKHAAKLSKTGQTPKLSGKSPSIPGTPSKRKSQVSAGSSLFTILPDSIFVFNLRRNKCFAETWNVYLHFYHFSRQRVWNKFFPMEDKDWGNVWSR